MANPHPLFAGVELGGTKCLCILGTGPDDVRELVSLPTKEPGSTLAAIEAVLTGWHEQGDGFAALGIGCFGPIERETGAPDHGRIKATPKAGWSDCDVVGQIAGQFSVPTAFDTDVNAAAIAEGRWGAAQGLEDYAYVTVGTGVGVGLIVAGSSIGGFGHSELGHIRTVRAPGDHWPGSCPFHGDCIEGLASGSAIAARLGAEPSCVADDHEVWLLVAQALGQLAHTLVLAATPRRIVMGGGVMAARPQLLAMMRSQLLKSLNGYVSATELDAIDDYIVGPALGGRAGPLGALALASDAMARLSAC